MRVRHNKVSGVADSRDGKVSSNAWNEDHVLTGTANQLLGFDSLGVGTEIDPATVGATPVADRTALAALIGQVGAARYLAESGREGTFVWSSADNSANVTADAEQGIYVAPATDTTGASGAWVRKFTGPAISTWWGVSTGGTASANKAAYRAALATLKALAVTGYGYANGSLGLHTPAGHYLFDNELTVTHVLECSGDYQGGLSGGGTVFEWTDFTHGFNVAGWDGASDQGSGATIKGLLLEGKGLNAGARGNWNAVNFSGRVNLINLMADTWGGSAYYGSGDFAGDAGDVNDSYFQNIAGQNCDWTLSLDGADANGCKGYGISAAVNRFGCISDSSFLGNAFYGGTVENCGLVANFKTRCHVSGHIYTVAYGQEAYCAANAPTGAATSNTGWLYVEEGSSSSTQPTWSAAQTWYYSSPLTSDPTNYNMISLFSGFYVETGQNPCVLSPYSRLDPARQIVPVWQYNGARHGGYMSGSGSTMLFNNGILVNGDGNVAGVLTVGPESGAAADGITYLDNTNFHSFIYGRTWAAGVPTTHGFIDFNAFGYVDINASETAIRLQYHGTDIATVTTNGVEIQTGKVLKVNGSTILNSSGVLQAAGFPALTGDVTTSAGSLATTIPAGTVTLAKMANMATSSLIYRKTAGSGAPEVNTLATLKTDLGLTGTNSGDQTITLTGDATGSGTSSFAVTLATINSNVGSFGSATQVPVITVDGKGRITAASSIAGLTRGQVLCLASANYLN